MRVFQINVEWNNGGPGSIAKKISDAVIESGGESYAAYGRGELDQSINSYRIGNKPLKFFNALLARLFDNAGFGTTIEAHRLLRIIDDCAPDIVQLHTLLGYYVNVEVLLKGIEKRNIPIVWTVHDTWIFTGHCINFDRISCEKWKTGCCHCQLQKDYPPSWFIDRSRINYKKKKELLTSTRNLHLVVPSEWMAKRISESFLKHIPCYTIHNGIDIADFSPTDSDLRGEFGLEGKIVLLAVANIWNEMKGSLLLGEIAELIDDDYKIVMIGNIQTSPNSDRILHIPATSDKKELAKWYSTADAFINPTFGDNFPTVNIEALACGTPVVTNDTGGSPEIAGNDFGRVVYSKTAKEFVEKIKECINENYSCEACRAHAIGLSAEKTYVKYIDLYESICKSSL